MLRGRLTWKFRETRLFVYLLIVGAFAAWKFVPRPWHPSTQVENGHHLIYSTADRGQIADTAHALGLVYQAYSNRLGSLDTFQRDHARLKVKLYKDRAEFRRI